MRDECIIAELHRVYGGGFYSYDPRPRCSRTFTWVVNGWKAYAPLSDALPYLRGKRKQAELALTLMWDARHGGLLIDEKQRRMDALEEMRGLNRRGI